MAVVQISRIQVRRGRALQGTGIPDNLASGEFAWAMDTQELYIGNGSVAEGAPAVGKTKIIDAAIIKRFLPFFLYRRSIDSVRNLAAITANIG